MATRSANIPVVPFGDGPSVAVGDLVGQKTVVLSGSFSGSFTLFASHDGANFSPVLLFNSDGQEQIALTLAEAYAFVRLRTNANTTGSVTAGISGVSVFGQNTFGAFPAVQAGASGPQPSIDTFALVPPTGFEADINVICSPTLLTGAIILEGSNDNVNFNPIGTFSGGQVQRTLVGLPAVLEFAPLQARDVVRYFRLNVQGQLAGPASFTIGGGVPSTGGGSSGVPIPFSVGPLSGHPGTNRVALSLPVSPPVFATGIQSIAEGVNATALADFGVAIGDTALATGPNDVVVGPNSRTNSDQGQCVVIGNVASVGNSLAAIVIGRSSAIGSNSSSTILLGDLGAIGDNSDFAIAIGHQVQAAASQCIAIGTQANAAAFQSIAIGSTATVAGASTLGIVIGFGSTIAGTSPNSQLLGDGALIDDLSDHAICIGSGSQVHSSSSNAIVIGSGAFVGDGVSPATNSTAIGPSASAKNTGALAAGLAAFANGVNAVALGAHATTVGNGSIALGSFVAASSNNSIAIGYNAGVLAGNDSGIAIGQGATVTETRSIAIGKAAIAADFDSVAIGTNAQTTVNSSIAIGPNALAAGANSIVLGNNAIAGDLSTEMIFLGHNTNGAPSITNAIAIGHGAGVTTDNQCVIGGTGGAGIEELTVSGNGLALVKFVGSAVAANQDSAFFLRYKDHTGTIVVSQVTVDAATGFLHVSP